ncbi:MAG: hypothetical protein Q7T41_04100 [Candidatus Saccharibacteria bacterium]|nr:hypothetical protein [Candidatus Saccharibacteria bacterium]
MNKTVMYIFITIGGGIGGYLPVLFGDSSMFSGWSVLGSTVGGILGILAAKRVSDY